jgi:ATP-binding cassette subfamily B protein
MTTSSSLPAEVIWPLSELHEAVPLLAGKAALLPADHPADLPPLPKDEATMEILTSWLESAARQLGLEARAAETVYPDLKDFLIQGAPALLPLPENTGSPGSFVLLAASRRRALRLLGRDGRLHRLPVNRVRDILVSDLEAPVLPVVESMLEQVNIREQQRGKVRKALLLEYLATTRVDGCWLLRLPPSTSFFRQLRRAKFPRRLSGLVGATLAARLLILGASFLVGKTIFQGNADLSDFQLWGLLLFTALPLQLTSMQVKNRLSIHFGILLRSRLLHGILQLRPEEIQHQGSGYFIGNVQEIEQLEAMGMSTAFMTLTAFLEVFIAAVVLMLGAGGIMHGALLLGWTGGILLLSRIYYRRMRDWLIHSRMMTCDLVERMVGHRTRLAQEKPEHMHVREDQLLSRYARLSERLDNMEVIMKSAAATSS